MSWNNLILTPEVGSGGYRPPQQARGAEKFERILDAAHELLKERNIEDFGLRDVAKRADVASGSVYHFFPNNELLYVALVDRYNEQFVNLINAPTDSTAISSWRDLIELHFEGARQFMNSNRPARTLILGSGRSWQSRQSSTAGDSDIAHALETSISEFFPLPTRPPAYDLLYLSMRTLEGYWELSVRQHDTVTDEIARETTRAVTAYLGLYWPAHLEPM